MIEKQHSQFDYFKGNLTLFIYRSSKLFKSFLDNKNEESESEGETSVMREKLLLKCKSVIENLHHEIEMLTQDKQNSEDKTKEL